MRVPSFLYIPRIEYDPRIYRFRQLLEVLWSSHGSRINTSNINRDYTHRIHVPAHLCSAWLCECTGFIVCYLKNLRLSHLSCEVDDGSFWCRYFFRVQKLQLFRHFRYIRLIWIRLHQDGFILLMDYFSSCTRLSRCGLVPRILLCLIDLPWRYPSVSIILNGMLSTMHNSHCWHRILFSDLKMKTGGEGDLKPKNRLSDWNCKDPTMLLSLILELRSLYMAYQKKRVGEVDDERLKFEINTIYSREGIEMYMSSGVDKPEEVKLAVPLLEMDLNKMVAGSTWRHQQKIYLQVIYPVSRKYLAMASAPRLKLVSSPELKAFFSIDEFRLPSWLEGMCMAEYLPTLEEMLESQIRDAISSIEVRRIFITALTIPFGRPLESDPVFCRKATFLACSGVFTFLVHISLPLQFPRQQPALMLQSSQHFHSHPGNAPIKSAILQDYPWSPRWNMVEMADRIFDYLVEECLNFKKYCNEVLVQQR